MSQLRKYVTKDRDGSGESIAHTAGSGRYPVFRAKLERARTQRSWSVSDKLTCNDWLAQFAAEVKQDLVVISKQYWNRIPASF